MDFKAWQFVKNGKDFDLVLVERGLPPTPPAGHVRVKVHAASLNYRDLIAWKNLANRPVDGRVPASDGAGEIIGVGEGGTSWRLGDRVAGTFFQDWLSGPFESRYHQSDLGGTLDGMLQEVIDLPETGVVAIPDSLSYEHASTLPCAGLTAYYSLFSRSQCLPGQFVLCIGTGGVSMFAAQFAIKAGAKPIVVSRSPEKLERASKLGVWETICSQDHANWSEEVLRLTNGRGAEHVVEVGGPGTLEESMKSVSASGHIALIGVLTGFGPPTASLFPLLAKNVTLDGIYVGSRSDFKAMNEFIAEHGIIPVIDKMFPFESAPEAFEYQWNGKHFGKVVVRVGV